MRFRAITQERRGEVYRNIEDISTISLSFFVMVVLSTTIAAYGLLANSTAVVIGAMLVAPLMGPIFGIGLALAAGDRMLLQKSIVSEILGVLVALLVGFLIGIIPLRLEFGSEIISRTQPTLYDIIIALASGLAGAYALVDERISPALPGVAIATALVPPLATCALCLAAGHKGMALGAFLLFFANFVAIEFAAALVFTLYGMSESKPHEPYTFFRFFKRFGLSLIALAIVAVFMTQTLTGLIEERRLSRKITTALSARLRSRPGMQVERVNLRRHAGLYEVTATVITPRELSSSQVGQLEDMLRSSVDPHITLVVRSLVSRDMDRNGIAFIEAHERAEMEKAGEEAKLLSLAGGTLRKSLASLAGARLSDVQMETGESPVTVIASVDTPVALVPAQVREMEKNLYEVLQLPVHLVVSSTLSREADAERFLYEEKTEAKPLTGEALAFHQNLRKVLSRELERQVRGSQLLELRYAGADGRFAILAVARTPVNFEPAKVKKIEQALRKKINPRTDLMVRSVVGTDTTSSGFVHDMREMLPARESEGNGEPGKKPPAQRKSSEN